MASNVVNYLNDIAKAVQAKKKSSDKISLKNLASEIRSFKTSIDELSDTMATNKVITTNGTYNVLNDKTITINVADIDDLAPFFKDDNYDSSNGNGDIVATLIYNDPEYGYSKYTAYSNYTTGTFDGLILEYNGFVPLSDLVDDMPLLIYKPNDGYLHSASSIYIDGEASFMRENYGSGSSGVLKSLDINCTYNNGYFLSICDSPSYRQKESLLGYANGHKLPNTKIDANITDLRLYLNSIPERSVITPTDVFNEVYSSDFIYRDSNGYYHKHTLSNEEIMYSQNGNIQSLDLYYSGSQSGDPTQHYAVVCNSSYSGSAIAYYYMSVGDVLFKPYATSGSISKETLGSHDIMFRYSVYDDVDDTQYAGMRYQTLGSDVNRNNSTIAYFDVNEQCILTTDLRNQYGGHYVAYPDSNNNLDFEYLESDKIIYCTASSSNSANHPSVATMEQLTPLIFYNYNLSGSKYTSILNVENDIIASTTYNFNTNQATTNLVFSKGGDYTSSAYTLEPFNTVLDLDLNDALIYNHRTQIPDSSGYNYEYKKIDYRPGTIFTVNEDGNIEKAPYDLSSGAIVNEVAENDVFIADGDRELQEVTLNRNTIIAKEISNSIPTVTELPVGQVAYYTGSAYTDMIEFTDTAAIREPIILYRYKENGMAELNLYNDICVSISLESASVYDTGEENYEPNVNLVFKYRTGYSSSAFTIPTDNIAIDLPLDAVMFSALEGNEKITKTVSFYPGSNTTKLLFTSPSGSGNGDYPTLMSLDYYNDRGKFFMYLDKEGDFKYKRGAAHGIIQSQDGSPITVTYEMINALVDAGLLNESERIVLPN